MQKRRAAIVAPVRTGVGAFGKSLRPVSVEDLIAAVVNETIKRSGVDPAIADPKSKSFSNIRIQTNTGKQNYPQPFSI